MPSNPRFGRKFAPIVSGNAATMLAPEPETVLSVPAGTTRASTVPSRLTRRTLGRYSSATQNPRSRGSTTRPSLSIPRGLVPSDAHVESTDASFFGVGRTE